MITTRLEEKSSAYSKISLLSQKFYSSLFEEDINTAAVSQKWNLVIKHITVLKTDVNKFPNDKCSVLHTAVIYKKNDVVALLLENEAKTDVLDKDENATPLHVAIKTDNIIAAKLLLLNNADYENIKNKDGFTALALAQRFNNYKMAVFNEFFSVKEKMLIADKENNYQNFTADYLKSFKANVAAGEAIIQLADSNELEYLIVQHIIKKAKPYYIKAIEYFKLLSDVEKSANNEVIERINNHLSKIGIVYSQEDFDNTAALPSFSEEHKFSKIKNRKFSEQQYLIETSSSYENKGLPLDNDNKQLPSGIAHCKYK